MDISIITSPQPCFSVHKSYKIWFTIFLFHPYSQHSDSHMHGKKINFIKQTTKNILLTIFLIIFCVVLQTHEKRWHENRYSDWRIVACKFGVLCVKRQTLKAEETGSDENFCYALLLSRQIMNLFLLIFYVHFLITFLCWRWRTWSRKVFFQWNKVFLHHRD